jgi:homoserine kinase type II
MNDSLLAAWPITAPWSIRPQSGGINNDTRFVETPSGNFILRIYGATRDLAKIRYELAVMAELRRQPLSFAVAEPLPSRSGDPIVLTDTGAPAILMPVIAGIQAERGSLEQAFPIGVALGELTRAMGNVRAEAPPSWRGTYGDLAPFPDIDPLSVASQAPISPEEQDRLKKLIRWVQERVPAMYAALPRQIIHGDFVPYNLLMQGNRVSAVLDFEIAMHDLRALDLAMALAAWGSGRWHTGDEWTMLEAFCRGYFSRMTLTQAEIEALPFLMRLRRSVNFLHMCGRYLRGAAPLEIALHGSSGALELDGWLELHGPELVTRVSAWARNAVAE